MKNKKVLFLFVAVIVLCLSTALFAACNKNDTQPPSGSSFKMNAVHKDRAAVAADRPIQNAEQSGLSCPGGSR